MADKVPKINLLDFIKLKQFCKKIRMNYLMLSQQK